MEREPRGASLGKAGGKIVTAAGVGDSDGKRNRSAGAGRCWSLHVHAEHVAKPVPRKPRLLRICALALNVGPEAARVRALLVSRGEAEGRKLRIRRNIPALVHIFTDQAGDVGIAADTMVREEWMRGPALIG